MKLCIIGLGYVGLPAACVLAQAGHEVVGVEIRSEVVEGLNQGKLHIDEPGLHDLLQEALANERFRAQTTPETADAFILCVPTPFKVGYQPDLSYVESAARCVLPILKEGDLVVVESTIPVGATEKVEALIRTARPELPQEALHIARSGCFRAMRSGKSSTTTAWWAAPQKKPQNGQRACTGASAEAQLRKQRRARPNWPS